MGRVVASGARHSAYGNELFRTFREAPDLDIEAPADLARTHSAFELKCVIYSTPTSSRRNEGVD